MIVVVGGTGQVGRQVVTQLVERGLPVRSVSRGLDPDTVPMGAEAARADLADPASLEESWTTYFGKYLPADAGQASWVFHPGPGLTDRLSPWTGFGVMCLWVIGLVVIAAIQLRRRDA